MMKIGSLLVFNDEQLFVVIGGESPLWEIFSVEIPGSFIIDTTDAWYQNHFTILLE